MFLVRSNPVYLYRIGALACIISHAFSKVIDHHAKLGPLALREQIAIPPEWTAAGIPDPELNIVLHIGLQQNNILGLEKKLLDISNPNVKIMASGSPSRN